MNAALTKPKVLAVVVSAMVLAVVIAGLFVAGSPTKERQKRLDTERLNHLQQIASGIDYFYQEKRALPASLDELRSSPGTSYLQTISDPRTGEPYEYHTLTDASYEICATFELASETGSKGDPYAPPVPYGYPSRVPVSHDPSFWNHQAGRTCFTIDEKDRLPQLSGGSSPSCTLMHNKKTGRVDCFGCAGTTCKDPEPNFEPLILSPDYVGIPYACYETADGCELAQ